MRRAADILYLFSSYSLRAEMNAKALAYGRVGHKLFPEDPRIIETYAYALMLAGNIQQAEEVLSTAPQETRNTALLRTKTSMALQLPKDEIRERIKGYLSY